MALARLTLQVSRAAAHLPSSCSPGEMESSTSKLHPRAQNAAAYQSFTKHSYQTRCFTCYGVKNLTPALLEVSNSQCYFMTQCTRPAWKARSRSLASTFCRLSATPANLRESKDLLSHRLPSPSLFARRLSRMCFPHTGGCSLQLVRSHRQLMCFSEQTVDPQGMVLFEGKQLQSTRNPSHRSQQAR